MHLICSMPVVLELFHHYLDNSSNWLFHLLQPMQDVTLKVAAPVYINPHFDLEGGKIPMPNTLNADPTGLLGNIKHKQNIKCIKK